MAARLRSVLSLAGIPQEGFPVKVRGRGDVTVPSLCLMHMGLKACHGGSSVVLLFQPPILSLDFSHDKRGHV